MTFDIGSLTDVGRRRPGNEDSLDVLPMGEGTLCVVADGMGGHQAGEVASRLAVETIRHVFLRNDAEPAEALSTAIRVANRSVFDESESDPEKQGMGTTVVCALLHNGRAYLANVGDSPAFLVRGNEAMQVTQDHSWVAEEVSRGVLQAEDAANHPYRHILTRCLGVTEDVEVQVYEPLELYSGDVLILCSDGLSEHVHLEDLAEAVEGRSAQAAAERLVALANERGGSDNITVIVARWNETTEIIQRADVTTELYT
jgi:PPM family protein phosphatase